MKPILTLKNYSTLYFDRNEGCWDLNKPDGTLGEDYLIKRAGCKLNIYHSSEYFKDEYDLNDIDALLEVKILYTEYPIVAVFSDGQYIMFENLLELGSLNIRTAYKVNSFISATYMYSGEIDYIDEFADNLADSIGDSLISLAYEPEAFDEKSGKILISIKLNDYFPAYNIVNNLVSQITYGYADGDYKGMCFSLFDNPDILYEEAPYND